MMLGSARYRTYFKAAGGDAGRAAELYEWSTKLSGAWHSHIGYVEVAVRNAIDRELALWNSTQVNASNIPYGRAWTSKDGSAAAIYAVIGKHLSQARDSAAREMRRRPRSHPRKDVEPNHDDIVAQLTFGVWARLVMTPHGPDSNQQELWKQSLHRAFPRASTDESGRIWVGRQLEGIRHLRNRVAHHDNLLSVKTEARLNGSLALLASIHKDFPRLAMGSNNLRQLAASDPRLQWKISDDRYRTISAQHDT